MAGRILYTTKAPDQKEPLLPTPDWKDLEPGDLHASDLFTEQAGYNDANVTGWDGRNVYGVTIGLVQMHVNLAMIPGNMSNATTFDFPILYRRMNAEDVADVMAEEPTRNFTDAVVEAAQWPRSRICADMGAVKREGTPTNSKRPPNGWSRPESGLAGVPRGRV